MFRKLGLLEWVVSLGVMGFLLYMAMPKWQAFRCRAAQSEAKYRLEEIRNAEELHLTVHQTYATLATLRQKGWLKHEPTYYDFQDQQAPDQSRYHIAAKGKAGTLVQTDLWEITPKLPDARHTRDACGAFSAANKTSQRP